VTATALAANGAKVYISGRRLEPLQAAARDVGVGEIIPVQADVSNKEGIKSVYLLLARRHWMTGRS
jgi:NADP-dependent 3-hydroxy acid dehydrogenase YdfG